MRGAHNERMTSERRPPPHKGHSPSPVPSIKRIGGKRNEFGTRIARRVDCVRCGRSDHVAYVPREMGRALCRACAAEVARTVEFGVKARVPTRDVPCNLCGITFALPVTAEDDGDLLCPSCLKGWTTWQGSLETPHEERGMAELENRRSGTKLRRRDR